LEFCPGRAPLVGTSRVRKLESGRSPINPNYVERAAIDADFAVLRADEIIDRDDMVENKPIADMLVVLQKDRKDRTT